MNIGFVSTWFERGASYVTKQYLKLLSSENNVFVYARGGEEYAIGNKDWDKSYVTWGDRLGYVDEINWSHIKKWIKKNKLDIIFFNEQRDIGILLKINKEFPEIKLGSYIDYYKQDTIDDFKIYDFLICNTIRHYNTFKWHEQCYYIPWGTDTSLYNIDKRCHNKQITFFHSAGMSMRKGTSKLIEVFLNSDLKITSKLIIHTQLPISRFTKLPQDELNKNNIEIIEKTVAAPGLYYLGDIYVYPTELDGLGLTIYEALSSGLPVIGTDVAPINEIINEDTGKLIDIEKQYCRSDAYYWPLSTIKKDSLYECMKYYVDNVEKLPELKRKARDIAIKEYSWNDRAQKINWIFKKTKKISLLSDEDFFYIRRKRNFKQIYKIVYTTSELLQFNILRRIILKLSNRYRNK